MMMKPKTRKRVVSYTALGLVLLMLTGVVASYIGGMPIAA
jgi:hypothetical protein